MRLSVSPIIAIFKVQTAQNMGGLLLFLLIPVAIGVFVVLLTDRIAKKKHLPQWWSVTNGVSLAPVGFWIPALILAIDSINDPSASGDPSMLQMVFFGIVLLYPVILLLLSYLSFLLYRKHENWISLIPPIAGCCISVLCFIMLFYV